MSSTTPRAAALVDLLGNEDDRAKDFAGHLSMVLDDPLSSLRVGPLPGMNWKETAANVRRHFLRSMENVDKRSKNTVDVSVLLVPASASKAVVDEKVSKSLVHLLHGSPIYRQGWLLDDEWVSFVSTVIGAMKQRTRPELCVLSRVNLDEPAIDLFKRALESCFVAAPTKKNSQSVLLDLVVSKSAGA